MAKLIDFYADWCGPCKQQTPIVEQLAEDRDDFTLEKVDIDENNQMASEYGVRSIPTLVLEDDDGNRIERFVGVTQRERIVEALDKL